MAKKGQKQLTTAQREELVGRAAAGVPTSQLAKEYGILVRQAYRVIDAAKPSGERREGQGRRRPGPPDERVRNALSKMREGRSVTALAREVGVDRGTLYRWARKFNDPAG